MVNRLNLDFEFSDSRGELVQLVHGGFKQVNVLTSHQGAIRGKHFHKVVKEAFYVIYGQVELICYTFGHEEESEKYIFKKGDFFEIQPGTVHSMFFPVECIMVQMYNNPVITKNGKKDIYSEYQH